MFTRLLRYVFKQKINRAKRARYSRSASKSRINFHENSKSRDWRKSPYARLRTKITSSSHVHYAASVNGNAVLSVRSYSTINYMNGITYGTWTMRLPMSYLVKSQFGSDFKQILTLYWVILTGTNLAGELFFYWNL